MIIGENGVGKTTLLDAIYAATLQPISEKLGRYMVIYTINNTDQYYAKMSNFTFLDDISLDGIKEKKKSKKSLDKAGIKETEYYSKLIKYESYEKKINGYYGLITIQSNGIICIDNNICILDTVSKKNSKWELLPMNVVYNPIISPSRDAASRFVTKTRYIQIPKVLTSNLIGFLIDDKKSEDSIIRSSPYISLEPIFLHDLTRSYDKYKETYHMIQKYLSIVQSQNCFTLYKKYNFFIAIWVSFLSRITSDELIDSNILDNFLNSSFSKKFDSHEKLFKIVTCIFDSCFKYSSPKLIKQYRRMVSLILNFPEEPFESLVYVYRKTGFSLRFSSDYVFQNPTWADRIYEFIKLKDEFNVPLSIKN